MTSRACRREREKEGGVEKVEEGNSRFCEQQLLLLRPLLASCTTEATMAKLRRSDARLH